MANSEHLAIRKSGVEAWNQWRTRNPGIDPDLSEANLSRTNLAYVDVRYGQLSQCDLTSARLTGAMLYGTTQDDWIIQGVECEYVFWDADAKVRSPEDRDFAPGEFERLYRTLPTIEYVFKNGMTLLDPLIMDRVVPGHSGTGPRLGHESRFDQRTRARAVYQVHRPAGRT